MKKIKIKNKCLYLTPVLHISHTTLLSIRAALIAMLRVLNDILCTY